MEEYLDSGDIFTPEYISDGLVLTGGNYEIDGLLTIDDRKLIFYEGSQERHSLPFVKSNHIYLQGDTLVYTEANYDFDSSIPQYANLVINDIFLRLVRNNDRAELYGLNSGQSPDRKLSEATGWSDQWGGSEATDQSIPSLYETSSKGRAKPIILEEGQFFRLVNLNIDFVVIIQYSEKTSEDYIKLNLFFEYKNDNGRLPLQLQYSNPEIAYLRDRVARDKIHPKQEYEEDLQKWYVQVKLAKQRLTAWPLVPNFPKIENYSGS
jgi:hypothetical protein